MKQRNSRHWLLTTSLLCSALLLACAAPNPKTDGSVVFAAFGDAPYRDDDFRPYQRVLTELSNAAELQFVIHVGDMFARDCSDAHYAVRRAEFRRLRPPLVLTPGDNDWTDCHREVFGEFTPLERLARLRAMFFADRTRALGMTAMTLERQSANPAWREFDENALWLKGEVVFVTVHLVGSKNGLAPFPGRTAADNVESRRRTEAATDWMQTAFSLAETQNAEALVIAMHASMRPLRGRSAPFRQYYEPFFSALENAALEFEKPVLLIHGDSHEHLVDKPFTDARTGKTIANFTRTVVMGAPDVGWLQIRFQPGSVSEPFMIEAHRTTDH